MDHLDLLLKKVQAKPPSTLSLLPDEVACLISSFLLSSPPETRSKAYLVLSLYCQATRSAFTSSSDSDPATPSLVRTFSPIVASRLSDTDEESILSALSFLAALFQVDWQTATSILSQDGRIDSVTDALDTFANSKSLNLAAAHLLSQASGHKAARAIIPSQCSQWLTAKANQRSDSALRAAAAVALIKLSRAAASESTDVEGRKESSADRELAGLMKGLLLTETDDTSLADAIEGLAYMSADPEMKESLSSDEPFLKRLCSFVPARKKTQPSRPEDTKSSLLYGVIVIISNLCAYRPRMSDEQAQMEKLRRMAKAGAAPSGKLADPGVNPLDDDEHVKQRAQRLIKAGAIDALVAAARLSDSHGLQIGVGAALLSLVEDKANRGKVLQSGGAKTLLSIIRAMDAKADTADPAALAPIQALAKLAITSSPLQVFGPDSGVLYNAIRPLSILLIAPAANLLQRFEGMMALTNIASHTADACARVAQADGLIDKVELLFLEEHALVRRAAVELLCNMVAGSEAVFARYTSEAGAKARLHILLALSDVDDLATRMAASGALATLTASEDACVRLAELQREKRRVLLIFAQLIGEGAEGGESDPGLMHRGVVCVRNLLDGCGDAGVRKEVAKDAPEAGLVKALVGVLKASGVEGIQK